MPDKPEDAANAPEGTIRLTPAILAGLDHASRLVPGNPAREELAQRILTDWLRANGHLRGRGCDEGRRPEDLHTGNDD